ncbi:MAG: GNAT family N-acetyltransferase [Novosphingobium sp.]
MIETERLLLRPWRAEDRDRSWEMEQDAEMMRYLFPLTREQSEAKIVRQIAHQAEYGYCFWAVERKRDSRLIGKCGIIPPRAPTFEHELGWRFESACWGQGYAREAAQATLEWAWANIDTQTVIAITNPVNTRSWGLMLRLGMTRNPDDDFDHADVAEGDPLRRCVLYRINRPQ